LILEEDIIRVGIIDNSTLNCIKEVSFNVNKILTSFFESKGLRFVDIKLEFGIDRHCEVVLADEISGDTFRVLDERGEHLDKEVFRRTRDVGSLLKAYLRLAERIGIGIEDVYTPS
jgi:phosphoribosylaminoimidazole-succinocarboxamide synthase